MSIGFYGRNSLPACFHMAMRHEIQYVGNENGFLSDYGLHISPKMIAWDTKYNAKVDLSRGSVGILTGLRRRGIYVLIPTGIIKNESVQASHIWNYGSR